MIVVLFLFTELWGLVNNAGIMSFCDVEVTPIKEWQRLFDINCLGQVRMIQAFLPLLRRSQGRIVNIASTHGAYYVLLPFEAGLNPGFLGFKRTY